MQTPIETSRRISAAGLTAPKRKQPDNIEPIKRKLSAAQLRVPVARQAVTPVPSGPAPQLGAENVALFKRLRLLLNACGTNKNDCAIALITACIGEGINTGSQIVGVLTHLGFDNRHAGAMLKHGTGNSSELHRWHRGVDGNYLLFG